MIAQKLLDKIRSGEITNVDQLELAKIKLSNGSDLIKNSDIVALLKEDDPDYEHLRRFLKIKNVRTASGVANIAVMWSPGNCPGNCIYCPTAEEDGKLIAPKSYTGCEPTTLRAIRNNYDPFLQVTNRVKQLQLIGHPTDKCELIIMGGTFMVATKEFRENFVKRCLDAFNGFESTDFAAAKLANENASNRCVGLTIETRADFCTKEQIEEMLSLGCTRVELGVQSTDDEILKMIHRGHDAKANIDAIRRLKDAGLKVCVHWMPGLTGLNGEINKQKEIEMFAKLFSPDYSPDELKIYPTLVVPGTTLHEMWKEGKYVPLEKDQMINLLIEFKKIVPEWVRIKRVMRDISEHKSAAGVKTTNLRQLAKQIMEKSGDACRCIRCREAGHIKAEGIPTMKKIEYEASGGKEIFLSVENSALLGFLRLRLGETTRIRELHVYGRMVPIGKQEDAQGASYSRGDAQQHKGVGRLLLEHAEQLARENKASKITVTSGIGVRDYYRHLGYSFDGIYMVKTVFLV